MSRVSCEPGECGGAQTEPDKLSTSRCRSSLPGDESAQGLSGQVNTGRTLCHHPKPSPFGRFALRAVRPSRGIIRYAHPSGRTELRALLRYAPFLQGNPVFLALLFRRAFTPALLHYVPIFKP